MKRLLALLTLLALLASACKGSSSASDVAAPSVTTVASAPPSASATTTTVASVATIAPSVSATSTATSPPSAPRCNCARIRVGDTYPHQNGHAVAFHDQDVKVVSVDATGCNVTVRKVGDGGSTSVERCDAPLFDEPRINPAG